MYRALRCILAMTMLSVSVARADGGPAGDFHQHVFSDDTIALIGPEASLVPLPAKDLVALLDAAGIRKAVLLSTAYMFGSPQRQVEDEYARVRQENDWTAAQAAQRRASARSGPGECSTGATLPRATTCARATPGPCFAGCP